VRIVVAFSEHGTAISVSDDGVGFDVKTTLEQLLDSSHNGLISLRYRTESIGGVLRVRSEPGKGTTLQFRLPRQQKRGAAEVARPGAERGLQRADWESESAETGLPVPESIRGALAEAVSSLLEYEPSVELPRKVRK